MAKRNLSRDVQMFFGVEIRNKDGVQPATLGSAMDTLKQAPIEIVLNWCGYDEKRYPKDLAKDMLDRLEYDIRMIICECGTTRVLESI
jgi:hypothetical protein